MSDLFGTPLFVRIISVWLLSGAEATPETAEKDGCEEKPESLIHMSFSVVSVSSVPGINKNAV